MPWVILPTSTDIIAIHAALLPTSPKGDILCFGDWSNPGPTTHTRLFHIDPEQMEIIAAANLPNTNAFCGAQAFLADGRLLVGGGTVDWPTIPADQPLPPGEIHGHHYHGERACWIYQARQKKWVRVKDFNFQPGSDTKGGGRWYPSLVTLGNGDVFAVGGHPDTTDDFEGRHNNTTPERYSAAADAWTLMAGDRTAPAGEVNDSFPRFHLLPDGRLFSDTAGKGGLKRIFDPFAGTWTGGDLDFASWDTFYDRGSSGTSVLLPLLPPNYGARILACNGAKAYRLDISDLKWKETAARTGTAAGKIRNHCCAVILPTGNVLLSGGVQASPAQGQPVIPVFTPELYEPGLDFAQGDFSGTEKWSTLGGAESATVARGYHSVALLLPDGRVWTAGSTEGGIADAEKRVEVYEPSYFGQANRPTISSAPANVGYGQAFTVGTPQAAKIKRVALLRCGSVTHAFNADQRYLGLTFEKGEGNTLQVIAPPNGNVAPPGYYMLWIVDDQGRPCQLAKFIRVSEQKCEIALDVSTYSRHEVQAAGLPAVFSKAIYVIYDAFLPEEVEEPTLTLRRQDNSAPPGVTLQLNSVSYEAGPGQPDVAQRIAYCYDVVIGSNQAFDQIPASDAFQTVALKATMKHFVCQVPLTLSKNPNPFMRDGNPSYLSIDVRVFKTRDFETKPFAPGIQQNAGGNAPFEYIQALLASYNSGGGQFEAIPQGQEASRLALYTHDDDGKRVYNYAVARVRYRAPAGVDAQDVRLFFRMCTTGWTGLDYDTNASYRRHGDGPGAAPLLGLIGGEINTIPCFAVPRVADMKTQTDPPNQRTLAGAGNQEVHAYFGCQLDINDVVPRFPLVPIGDGPFQELWPGFLRTFQQVMRGLHQCVVAELHYTLDPIANGATPGTSDNLAQRNILLDLSDNPGSFATHLVQHTFELKPSLAPPGGIMGGPGEAGHHEHDHGLQNALVHTAATGARFRSDYLMIEWGNLPRDTHATFYLPTVDTETLLEAAGMRQGPAILGRGGVGTIQCRVTDIAFLPIPAAPQAIAGLLTLQLPPNVARGQTFSIVLRQVQGRTNRIIGTFQFDVVVKTRAEILPLLKRNYSVLRYIGQSIPAGNRWHPVWERYLDQFGDRLRAFGEDPESIAPTPTGDGKPSPGGEPGGGGQDRPGEERCFTGKLEALHYDCFGDFQGFTVEDCGRQRRFRGHRPTLEELVRRACCDQKRITVCFDPRHAETPTRIVVHC